MSKPTLDQDFRNIVNAFCERNNMKPEQIGNQIGYKNRQRISDCFVFKKSMINAKTQARFVEYMQTIEPDLIVRTVAYKAEQKAVGMVIDELSNPQ